MKFLCDVHISFKIVKHLSSLGFKAIHVNNILDRWPTKDKDICAYADKNDLIIITKDVDFRDSFFYSEYPKKISKNKSRKYLKSGSDRNYYKEFKGHRKVKHTSFIFSRNRSRLHNFCKLMFLDCIL